MAEPKKAYQRLAVAAPSSQTPEKEIRKVACSPARASVAKKKAGDIENVQIVYIDHFPEPFVKSYFGDDMAQAPDDVQGWFRPRISGNIESRL